MWELLRTSESRMVYVHPRNEEKVVKKRAEGESYGVWGEGLEESLIGNRYLIYELAKSY